MLPFLNAGMMLAVSQSLGKVPKFYDWVNITCNTGATCSAQVLRIHVGPAVLPGLRFCTMPPMSNVMWVLNSGMLLSSLRDLFTSNQNLLRLFVKESSNKC